MIPEQREVLDEIVMKMRSGRISKRTFLERAFTIGLSSIGAATLLDACGSITTRCSSKSPISKPNTIVWASEHDYHDIFDKLISDFNSRHTGEQVIYLNDPFPDRQQYVQTSNMLRACSEAVDVVSVDVIWLPEFADKALISPLTDNSLAKKVRDKYTSLKGVVESCTYGDTIYSAPLRVDIGILYYRSNLTSKAPDTWSELVEQSTQAVAAKKENIKEGYVWQGNKYEGLVCNFVEVLAGYGGSILNRDNTKVTISGSEGVAALTEMVNWVDTISPTGPDGITSYEESDARVRWQNSFAVFMRNWYNVWPLVTDPSMSQVYATARYAAIPHGESTSVGHSCIGGWQLGVNAASQKADIAWEFIGDVLSNPLTASFVPTDIASSQADSPSLSDIFDKAVWRPRLPKYAQMSKSIQNRVFNALQKKETPSEALMNLKVELDHIIAS